MNKFRLISVFVVLAMLFSFANVSSVAAAGPIVPVTFQEGTATFSQGDWCCNLNVDEAVDGQLYDYGASGTYNGWAIYNGSSDPQTAVWETASDVNASRLDFVLYHTWAGSSNLGRFRLSYTTDDRSTFADGLNSYGDVTANWTVLTGATISGAGGETFTVLGDNSILVGGNNPATTIYSVSFEGSFNGVTGIRLEALSDPSLPDNGPGRAGNGNFHLVEITLDATSTPSGPESCQDIRNANPSATDGDYVIYPNNQMFTVYCHDMAGTPSEYLTLANTGGSSNFSQLKGGGAIPNTDVVTHYTKVRLNPATLLVDINDKTFSSSTGYNSNWNGISAMDYGVALGCAGGFYANAQGNIDLTGTQFAVDDTFTVRGWQPAGSATFSSNDQIISFLGGGYCGWISPTGSEDSWYYDQEAYFLSLRYVPDVCPADITGPLFTNGPTFGTICDDGGRAISIDKNVTFNDQPAVRFDVPSGPGQVLISACDASKDAILYTIAENQAAEFTVQCGSSNMEMISGEMLMELYFSSNLLASGTALSGTALNYETLNLEQQFNLASGALELQLLNLAGGNLALAELSAGNSLLLNQASGELSALSTSLGLLQLTLQNLAEGNLALAELSAGNGLLLEQATGEMSALSTNTSLLELQLLTALGGNLALAELSAGNGLLLDQATGEMSALLTNTNLLELQLLNLAGTNLAMANLEAGSGLLYDQQAGQLEALASAVQLQFLSAAQQTLINASLGSGSTVSFDQALGALEVLQGAIDAGWLDETGAEIASGLIQAGQEVIFNQLLSEFQVSSLGGLVEMVFQGSGTYSMLLQGSGSFSVLAGELDLTLLDVVGAVVGRLSMDSGDTALWDAVQSLLTVDAGFMNVLLLDESGVFAQTLLESGESFDLSAANSPLDILNAMLGLNFMNLTGPALGPQVATGSDHVNPPGTSVPLSAVGHLDVRDPGNIHPDGLNPDFFQNHITDVWAWGNYAYLGSFDRPFCSRQTTGVHIIDISDPAAPAYAGFLPSPDSTRPNDVKVFHIETPSFTGEILVHTNEKCTLGWTAAEDLSTVQAIDPPLPDPALGVGIYDVTDPLNPVLLDASFLDFQTHNTYLWQHGENAYMAVVSDDNNRGLHIVDMTDPANPSEIAVIDQTVYPQLVGQEGLLGHSPTPHEDGHAGADVLLHDVWVQENDGRVIAYLSYWDVGMVLFDVTDPTNPVFLGDSEYFIIDPVTGGTAAGNSHVAVPSEDGKICIGGDEDFFGEAGWGYGRVYDCTDPANIEEIGQIHTNNVQTPPPGNFTAHNVMVAEDLASWAWYFDGIPVFDFSSCRDANGAPVAACTPVEVGRFVDPNGSDFWGVYLHEINGVTYLLGSDRDTGLWIIPAVDRPNAIADTFNIGDGAPLTVEAPGVLYNDVDNDSVSLAAELVAQASNGFVDLSIDGSFTYTPNGNYCVSDSFTYRASDGALDSNVATVTINCQPTADAGGPYLVAVNSSIAFDGSGSTDPDGDTLTETWTAGGGTVVGNVFTSGSEAGIFDVCLSVNDGTVDSDAACTIVVVYDPSGGFVTGGGWIDSPAGAYNDDESLSGKATFGFVSKYKKGATVPTGNTEFHFKAAGFNFHSGTYEWLVVNQGGANAQFRGEGTVNDALDSNGNAYKFMVWAGDGSPDTFRIRIWSELDGVETVVYDNGFDQELGGGSIVIHTRK